MGLLIVAGGSMVTSLESMKSSGETISHPLHRPTASITAITVDNLPVLSSDKIVNLPILLYHDTPPNFESQLKHIRDKGYSTITFAQATAGWHNITPLPAKPVIITFDDGFADQIDAFNLLKKYSMYATFYIINGSAKSRWCIGASRRYNDPLQPPAGCGNTYLHWDEIQMMDKSGLITIGGHTMDHANLPTLSSADQLKEIVDSKMGIETKLGHSITDFAYPYGLFDDTTIAAVHQAGYVTAVTTMSGTLQHPANAYTLHRVRDALILP